MGINRKQDLENARKLAAETAQNQSLGPELQALIERALTDPHVAGIRKGNIRAGIVKTKKEAEELSQDAQQKWIIDAFERGEVIVKISISGKRTRKRFAVRG